MTLAEMRKKIREEEAEEYDYTNEDDTFRGLDNTTDAGGVDKNDLSTSLKFLEDCVDIFEELQSVKASRSGKHYKKEIKKLKKLTHEITAFLSMYINEEI